MNRANISEENHRSQLNAYYHLFEKYEELKEKAEVLEMAIIKMLVTKEPELTEIAKEALKQWEAQK